MSDFRIIYTRPEDGGVSVIVPAPGVEIEEALKALPEGLEYSVIDKADQPDRTFRNAWEKQGNAIGHNMPKAREIAHEKRRRARDAEFKPYDDIISKQIPGSAAQQTEAARQAIRDKYAAMQVEIDAAADVVALKASIASIL